MNGSFSISSNRSRSNTKLSSLSSHIKIKQKRTEADDKWQKTEVSETKQKKIIILRIKMVKNINKITKKTKPVDTRHDNPKIKCVVRKFTGFKTYNIQWTCCGFVVHINWHATGIAIDMTIWIAHLFRFKFLQLDNETVRFGCFKCALAWSQLDSHRFQIQYNAGIFAIYTEHMFRFSVAHRLMWQ